MAETDIAAEVKTNVKKAGSSFYRAMTFLAPERRDGMFALYAFCREVDDIADDDGIPASQRLTRLQQWRTRIADIYRAAASPEAKYDTSHYLTGELLTTVRRYAPRQEDFIAIIDGMAMDIEEPIVAPSADMLDLYCDRVASAVGRISVHIFGDPSENGYRVAWHLGRALQLTNILRDLAEDAGRQRLYLPGPLLDQNGITGKDPAHILRHPAIGRVCSAVAATAQDHYRQAFAAMKSCRKGTMRASSLMGHAYKGILNRLMRRGWQPPLRRVGLPLWEKLWVLFRYGVIQWQA